MSSLGRGRRLLGQTRRVNRSGSAGTREAAAFNGESATLHLFPLTDPRCTAPSRTAQRNVFLQMKNAALHHFSDGEEILSICS